MTVTLGYNVIIFISFLTVIKSITVVLEAFDDYY